MRVKLLTLRYAPSLGGFDDRPLADFVRDKEVLQVREHFFSVHELPHIACLVTYQDPSLPHDDKQGTGARTRPKRSTMEELLEALSPEDRVLFGALREWRTGRARKDGVPPYVVFTNRELVAIVEAKPKTPTALQSLPGVGAGKVERYGREVARLLTGGSELPQETRS